MVQFSGNNKKYLGILTIFALVVLLFFGVYKNRAKNINIVIDNQKITKKTSENTVKDLLKKEGIHLEKEGYINLKLDDVLKEGTTVVIKNPKTYFLQNEDKKIEVKTTSNTVKDILNELKINLNEKDYTQPSLNEKVKPGETINIIKVDEKIEVVQKEIPFQNIVENSSQLEKGSSKILQDGKNGKKEIKIEKIYKNGKLESENIISEKILSEPTPKIIQKGTKNYFVASRGKLKYTKTLIMEATAYDLSYKSTGKRPGDRGYGITASGTKARYGIVSVDPKIIPLGTKLYIQSTDGTKDYGFATAGDTGKAIKNNRIDLFFHSSSQAKSFGRRKVKVYILEK